MKRAFSLFAFIMLLCILMPQARGQNQNILGFGAVSCGGSNPDGLVLYIVSCSNGDTIAEIVNPNARTNALDGGDWTPWDGYESNKPAGSISIPSIVTHEGISYPVKCIHGHTFVCCNITSVTIPNSVTTIGNEAFVGCSGLTSVTIGSSVTAIGEHAFYNCNGLTSVNYTGTITQWCNIDFANVESNPISHSHSLNINGTPVSNLVIPDGVTTIKQFAFIHCSGLTSVTIGNSVTSIGGSAFSGCSGLTSVTIGNSVTSIGNAAFERCYVLTSVTIPNSVTSIGRNAFERCSGLTSVTIPNSVTSIGSLAFDSCSGLTGPLTIPNSVTYIGTGAFGACSGLTSVIFNAESCIVAGGNNGHGFNLGAFEGDTNITSFIFGSNVKRIPSWLCKGLSQLASFTIPDSVTSIGEEAFQGCSGWTGSLSLPNTVTDIGGQAFSGCTGLTEIHSPNPVAPLGGADAFGGVTTTIPVYIPCGGLNSYLSRWSYFSNFIEDRGFTFSATSSNAQMGSVQTLTAPSCTNPLAVIYASANRGYRFVQWNDSNTVNPRTIPVSGDTSFVAIFDTNCIYTVTAANCLGAGTYQRGATAIVMAAPQSGTIFRRWADGVTSNPRYITVTSDTMLTPIFSSAGTDTVVVYDTVRLNTTVYDTTAVTHYVYDTVHHYQYDTLQVFNTVYDTTAVTRYVYDTVHHHQYDTLRVFNTVYDTTNVTRYVYDTVRVYDTLTVLNIDTVHHYHYDTVTNVHTLHYQYDTTRVYDTLTIVNMDTLHHYHYDTTAVNHYFYDTVRVFDTLTVLNIDTLHHYHYDTTRVYDTLTIVNIDTLHHYYYDTLRVFDTLTVLNVDTVHHYHYDTTAVNHYTFDTTRIYDTLTIVNVDTLRHYFYDTTRVFDTLTVLHSDTLHRYHTDTIVSFRTLYQYDTTRVYDTLRSVRIDTVHHYFYGYTTVDTLYRYFYDTTELTHLIFDTTTVTHYIYNTTWIVDTIYLYDTLYVGTEGINDAGWVNARVYTTGSEIVVEGLAGHTVRLYDITGRLLERRDDGYDIVRFPVPASGTYVVRIGDRTVRKVVVIL